MIAIAIGNGESRNAINLKHLPYYKIGCNAIFRDNFVNEVVCVDRRMVEEALRANFSNTIYTRLDWIDQYKNYKNVKIVPHLPYTGVNRPDDPFQWGSGPYAILLCAMQADVVKVVGFDLYSKNKLINNIYKDTINYDKSTHHVIDPRYWIYQISKVFYYYPTVNFLIYQPANWSCPTEWQYPNVSIDTIENLK